MKNKNKNYAKDFYEFLERKYPNIWKHQKNNEALKALYPAEDSNVKLKEFTIEKIRLCMLVGAACVFLGGVMWIKDATTKDIVYIQRNGYAEGSKKEELEVNREGDKDFDISFEVGEKEYTEKELNEIYDKFKEELLKEVLDKNESFEKITRDLKLEEEVEGYPFNVSWITQEEYISGDGVLINEILENPVPVVIEAHINGNGFTRIEQIPCLIFSREEPFTFEYKLKGYIEAKDLEERNKGELTLPSEFEGEKISFKNKNNNYGMLILFSAPVLMIVLYYCKDRDLMTEMNKRQEQLKQDYSGIVSKMALYLGAGLTIQNAWEKTAMSDSKGRYAYEEMKITQYEIESGVPFSTAYENFGKRCHENSYTKLVSVLMQNRKKGSNNVGAQLHDEASVAFEMRKQEAIKMGEKAGTKMLVPMTLLLLVVLIIVMAPAFMNQI